MSGRLRITCIVAICAILSSTAMVLFAGIAAACAGGGGGGGGGECSAPTASTGSATNITGNSATLTGSVNPQGCETYYYFEYGTSGSFPNEIGGLAGSGTSPVSVQTYSSLGLQPETKYNFRLTAVNSEGKEATGSVNYFTTTGGTEKACSKPTVTTEPASFISETSAQLNGSLNPNGCQTTYTFEYGPSSLPYQNKISETVSDRGFPFSVLKGVYGLQPSTSYHFRLVATNAKGTTEGSDKTFITEGKNPILFVEGWHGASGGWNEMINRFILYGWSPSLLYDWTYDWSQSNVTTAQLIANKVNQILLQTGRAKVDIIAHSMGSLSSRYYLKNLGGTAKVDDFVSLGGPNHGTNAAALLFCSSTPTSCNEMQYNSPFLTSLNSGDETPGSVQYLTIESDCDPVINPDDSVMLNGASNLIWDTPILSCPNSHSLLRTDSWVFDQVEQFVK